MTGLFPSINSCCVVLAGSTVVGLSVASTYDWLHWCELQTIDRHVTTRSRAPVNAAAARAVLLGHVE